MRPFYESDIRGCDAVGKASGKTWYAASRFIGAAGTNSRAA
ncbi:MAG TPA: hypothetical protein VME23_11170 [Terracidiphilus sp.]|nr:hypothetical protein [Terracidiphilus sp.]